MCALRVKEQTRSLETSLKETKAQLNTTRKDLAARDEKWESDLQKQLAAREEEIIALWKQEREAKEQQHK